MKKFFKFGAVATVATVAIIAGQSAGEASSPAATATPTRIQAYLVATQGELASSGYEVDAISQAAVIDGRQVYTLKGANAACILVAGVAQPAGHSQQLSCANGGDANSPDTPLATGFELSSGKGYVDLAWASDGAASPLAQDGDGAKLQTQVGANLVAAVRSTDDRSGTLSWTTADGRQANVSLLSRNQRNGRAQAAFHAGAAQ